MRLIFILLLFILSSCSKNEYEVPKAVTPRILEFPYRLIKQIIDENVFYYYTYGTNGRLLKIEKFDNETILETVTYTYSGNKAIVKSDVSKYEYTYYLNSNGIADSSETLLPGYASIKSYYYLSEKDQLIRKVESGWIVSVPFNQVTEYFYENNNVVLEKVIDENGESTIAHAYDLTVTNPLQGTQFLQEFIPGQPNIRVATTIEEEEEFSFTFDMVSDTFFTRVDISSNGNSYLNQFFLEKVNK